MGSLRAEIRLSHLKGKCENMFRFADFPPRISKLKSSVFLSSDGVLELESSLKKPIRDDNPLLPLICGGIEAILRQGLKSKHG